MNKKILSLVLAIAIVLGSFGSVALAAATTTETKSAMTDEKAKEALVNIPQQAKINALVDQKILAGRTVNADESADLALAESIRRDEVTKLIVYALKQESLAELLKGRMMPFPDVAIDQWANGFISAASTARVNKNARPIVIGNDKGLFEPENKVTYAELATMLVRIVVTDLDEKNMSWPNDYVVLAEKVGIFAGLPALNTTEAATRANAFEMIYNAIYRMDNNKPVMDYNEKIGIVSKLTQNEITFNQKDTFKLTSNTKITRGTTWSTLGLNFEYVNVGSLVRYIVNSNNEVTHIIEVGNQRDGVFTKARFNGLFKNDTKGYIFESPVFDHAGNNNDEVANVYLTRDYQGKYLDLKLALASGTTRDVEINSKTKLFAVDRQDNVIREVKTIGEVVNLLKVDNLDLITAYGSYEKVDNRYEARIIVFDNVAGKPDVKRVVRQHDLAGTYSVENTTGKVENLDTRNIPYFPTGKGTSSLRAYDVIDNRNNPNFAFDEYDFKVIDAATANVYEVVSYKNRELELKDKDGITRVLPVDRDVYEFLEGQVKKGAKVQIAYRNEYNAKETNKWISTEIDEKVSPVVTVISVVPSDWALKGALTKGALVRETAYIHEAQATTDNELSLTLVDVRKADGALIDRRNVKVTEAALTVFKQQLFDKGLISSPTASNQEVADVLNNQARYGKFKVAYDVNPYDGSQTSRIYNLQLVKNDAVDNKVTDNNFKLAAQKGVRNLNLESYKDVELVRDYVEFSYVAYADNAKITIKKGNTNDAIALTELAVNRGYLKDLGEAGLKEFTIGKSAKLYPNSQPTEIKNVLVNAIKEAANVGETGYTTINYTLTNGTSNTIVVEIARNVVEAQ